MIIYPSLLTCQHTNALFQPASLVLLLLITGACSSVNEGTEIQQHGDLVVMTYNIHHAAGSDGIINLERIARIIRSASPDLVALQEVDRGVERSERVDQAEMLAALTGMEMRFGFAINWQGGDFGNVILSKHPILASKTYPLPGPPGEDRVLVEVRIAWRDSLGKVHPVIFYGTHLDPIRTPREAAIPLILNTIPATPDTLRILAGDLNDGPDSQSIASLSESFTNTTQVPVFTYPATRPNRQIDYIFHAPSPFWEAVKTYTLDEPVASDHAPLVAIFQRTRQASN